MASVLFFIGNTNVFAYSDVQESEMQSDMSIKKILSSYHAQMQQLEIDTSNFKVSSIQSKRKQIQEEM